MSSIDEQQDFPDDEKTDFVGKIRTRRHRKVLSSDGLNYREGKRVVKNISSSGESDESENDSEFTRATHNVLERKRRNDLKLKFQKLRDCVPELKDNERAPKSFHSSEILGVYKPHQRRRNKTTCREGKTKEN